MRKPFPGGGLGWEDLQPAMEALTAGDADWRAGRTPVFYFFQDQETYEIGRKAFFAFFSMNALGKRAFQSVRRMESDVLDFGLDLFSAPDGAAGVFTSGGSESILLALKSARDSYRARSGAGFGTRLNVVMPVTAHPAFDKAADAMDIELRRAPLRADLRADVAAMRTMVDERTMALVGSAPCFSFGVIDPIDELSRLAEETGIWLHVDACVGGWIAPFFTRIGRPTPHFDFRFAGVRSLSADLHKFGFCPKPASTVFFRNGDDPARSSFKADAWPSGRFETQTLVGTRPAGAVAGAWAVLNHLGTSGFETAARRLSALVDRYCTGIAAIEGLALNGRPDVCNVNYGARDLDIFAIAELMSKRGWVPALTRRPDGANLMLAMQHEPAIGDYLADLGQCVAEARNSAAKSTLKAVY
jgi:sphinganine-1-phosphate aldolase